MKDIMFNQILDKRILKKIRDAYAGQTILITGGRGYIGSALTLALSEMDCRLILVDHSQAGWMPEAKKAHISLIKGNLSDMKTWETALPGVDYVFHLAAREYYYRSGYDPESDLRSNAVPVLYLLEACRKKQYTPKIVFASSANLYGSVDTLPVNEDNRDNPLTLWAIHKLMGEQYLRLYAEKYNISSISLRLSNVYGPSARSDVVTRVVLNKMIHQALAGKGLTIYANHHCIRDYLFIKDVINAFLLAGSCCRPMKNHVYIIGSGEGKTIGEVWHLIAERVRSHNGSAVPVQVDTSVAIEPLEMRSFIADTRRFQAASGWTPLTGLVQGIDNTVREFSSELRRDS